MLLFYRLAIALYGLLIRILSPFNEKARLFIRGRKGWEKRLQADLAGTKEKIVWVHAASLGEFEQGRPIIESIKEEHSEVKILLTFFSPSGYTIRKNYEFADWVYYLPLDTPTKSRRFVELVQPAFAIFIKYEFWYYFLKSLEQRNIPVLIASAIFRKSQLFFHWSGAFFRPVLKGITHYYVQDEESKKLIASISDKVSVSGDTRFDRVAAIAAQSRTFDVVDRFIGYEQCFVVGSSWPSDMEVLAPFIEKYQLQLKFIIAPHNIGDPDIDAVESMLSSATRYSKPKDLKQSRVLIVDNIGMLSSLYRYSDFVFIGGGYRGALHNTLEAAVFGVPIFFGDHEKNQKFREAIELTQLGAAFPVKTAKELNATFGNLLEDPENYEKASLAAKNYVTAHQGATDKIMSEIRKII